METLRNINSKIGITWKLGKNFIIETLVNISSKIGITWKLDKRYMATLLMGIIFGYGLAYVYMTLNINNSHQTSQPKSYFNFRTTKQRKVPQHSYAEERNQNEGLESENLSKDVRVLCWILTCPKNHATQAIHIRNTWGKRCNKLLFMSSEADKVLGSIALPNVSEGRDFLWGKTKEAFRYVYNHHFEEADWFMKADDDTYVIVENLRFMLQDFNTSYPIYFGFKFNYYVKQGYMSGGAGYVLSKESLRRFVEIALPNKTMCRQDSGGFEDVEMGECMEKVGVEAGDSRDSFERFRFSPMASDYFDTTPGKSIAFKYGFQGLECCSDILISFHYVTKNQMYMFEYLLYSLWPYGIKPHISGKNKINLSGSIIRPITTTTKLLLSNNAISVVPVPALIIRVFLYLSVTI